MAKRGVSVVSRQDTRHIQVRCPQEPDQKVVYIFCRFDWSAVRVYYVAVVVAAVLDELAESDGLVDYPVDVVNNVYVCPTHDGGLRKRSVAATQTNV